MSLKVLFFNHAQQACGVYQYGEKVFNAICKSNLFEFTYYKVQSAQDIAQAINLLEPDIAIFNWHQFTMPWCNDELLVNFPHVKFLAIWHDPNCTPPALIKNLISQDPTQPELVTADRSIFSSLRLIRDFAPMTMPHKLPVIGSAGFPNGHKNLPETITRIQNEFDEAIIRLHMPGGFFSGGQDSAKLHADACRQKLNKPGITLEISHDFLTSDDLLNWLSSNDINVFLYHDFQGHGISSIIDDALTVRQPMALSRSHMFRHVWDIPEIFVENLPIKKIMENGTAPLEKVYERWNEEKFVQKYEEILCVIC